MIPSIPSRTGNRMAVASFLLSRAMTVVCIVLLGMHWQIVRDATDSVPEGSTIVATIQGAIVGVLALSAISMALGIAGLWGTSKKRTAVYGILFSTIPFLCTAGSILGWQALS